MTAEAKQCPKQDYLRAEEVMRILALDLAEKTGFAHTDGTFGVKHFEWAKWPYGQRWNAFECWLRGMLVEHTTDQIAYEAALHQKGAAAHVANVLVGTIERVSWDSGLLTPKGYHNSTLKKHATGSGRATKVDMWEAAKKRNPDLKAETDDVVDALFLLDLALSELTPAP
jgi:Holliday junction resolvasome RuvABC endonuclease subunit